MRKPTAREMLPGFVGYVSGIRTVLVHVEGTLGKQYTDSSDRLELLRAVIRGVNADMEMVLKNMNDELYGGDDDRSAEDRAE